MALLYEDLQRLAQAHVGSDFATEKEGKKTVTKAVNEQAIAMQIAVDILFDLTLEVADEKANKETLKKPHLQTYFVNAARTTYKTASKDTQEAFKRILKDSIVIFMNPVFRRGNHPAEADIPYIMELRKKVYAFDEKGKTSKGTNTIFKQNMFLPAIMLTMASDPARYNDNKENLITLINAFAKALGTEGAKALGTADKKADRALITTIMEFARAKFDKFEKSQPEQSKIKMGDIFINTKLNREQLTSGTVYHQLAAFIGKKVAQLGKDTLKRGKPRKSPDQPGQPASSSSSSSTSRKEETGTLTYQQLLYLETFGKDQSTKEQAAEAANRIDDLYQLFLQGFNHETDDKLKAEARVEVSNSYKLCAKYKALLAVGSAEEIKRVIENYIKDCIAAWSSIPRNDNSSTSEKAKWSRIFSKILLELKQLLGDQAELKHATKCTHNFVLVSLIYDRMGELKTLLKYESPEESKAVEDFIKNFCYYLITKRNDGKFILKGDISESIDPRETGHFEICSRLSQEVSRTQQNQSMGTGAVAPSSSSSSSSLGGGNTAGTGTGASAPAAPDPHNALTMLARVAAGQEHLKAGGQLLRPEEVRRRLPTLFAPLRWLFGGRNTPATPSGSTDTNTDEAALPTKNGRERREEATKARHQKQRQQKSTAAREARAAEEAAKAEALRQREEEEKEEYNRSHPEAKKPHENAQSVPSDVEMFENSDYMGGGTEVQNTEEVQPGYLQAPKTPAVPTRRGSNASMNSTGSRISGEFG